MTLTVAKGIVSYYEAKNMLIQFGILLVTGLTTVVTINAVVTTETRRSNRPKKEAVTSYAYK